MRAVSLILALVLGLGGAARAAACPARARKTSDCCPGARPASDRAPHLAAACCCIQPQRGEAHRRVELAAPPVSPGAPAVEVRAFVPAAPDRAPRRLEATAHTSIPPPTLLRARTSFLH